MDQQVMKEQAANAAVDHIAQLENDDLVLGIGTGSTAECFIHKLSTLRGRIETTVASSERSALLLKALGIPVSDLNSVDSIDVYVDGADEANHHLQLIKGGGAALTREKIVAAVSKSFICIADESKLVKTLGTFPLPVEVIPMARSYAARELVKLGGQPVWREGIVTDNSNVILDVYGLAISQAISLEEKMNQITGVVCNGLFASRPADMLILGSSNGARTLTVD